MTLIPMNIEQLILIIIMIMTTKNIIGGACYVRVIPAIHNNPVHPENILQKHGHGVRMVGFFPWLAVINSFMFSQSIPY